MRTYLDHLEENFKYEGLRENGIAIALINWLKDDEIESVQEAIAQLQDVNCAGCSGPAPVYNHDMAQEIADCWQDILLAQDQYHDATGTYWTPKSSYCSFLSYLWFAYEWFANEMVTFLENMDQEEAA